MFKELLLASSLALGCFVSTANAAVPSQKPSIMLPLSPTELIKPGMIRKTCFPQFGTTKGFEIRENITKQQREALAMMKASSKVKELMIESWSIQNTALDCLNKGTPINGFTREIIKPTEKMSINSYYTLLPMNKYMTFVSKGLSVTKFKDIQLNVTFSPRKGYSVEITERQLMLETKKYN
jgi:hypothetical protein